MTPQEINFAIAEWCGDLEPPKCKPSIEQLEAILSEKRPLKVVIKPDGSCVAVRDFFTDLNAVHEAEERLTIDQTYVYLKSLETATCGLLNFNPHDWMKTAVVVHATSPQRCEALLRTIGKWKEEPK